MIATEYVAMFVLVAILGAGLPGPGDAALIAAGALVGEGKLNVFVVLATAMVAWLLGSVVGYGIGLREGRPLLDHSGPFEKSRLKLLGKGDRLFGRHNFAASVTLPAFVSGVFRVRFALFMLGALVAGIGWIGMYVGLAYFFGSEIADRIGTAGLRAVLAIAVLIVVGLIFRAAWSRWRTNRDRKAKSGARLAPD